MVRGPSRDELLAAADRTVEDVVAPGLKVLFCGINPGLYTAAVGHHFARPGNRFWPTLHAAGFTERVLEPRQERELLRYGYGITNVAPRASATAAELSREELLAGGRALVNKVLQLEPQYLAVLGIGAYRMAFRRPEATLGLQPERVGSTRLWVLPNPSGLNAHYRLERLTELFRELRLAVERDDNAGGS